MATAAEAEEAMLQPDLVLPPPLRYHPRQEQRQSQGEATAVRGYHREGRVGKGRGKAGDRRLQYETITVKARGLDDEKRRTV